jgi:hypothetical protein
LVASPSCEVLEYDGPSDRHIQTCCLVRVLRDVYKIVTKRYLSLIEARAFVAKHEQSIALKGVLLNRSRARHDFDATYFNVLFDAVSFDFIDVVEKARRHFGCGALRSERVNFVFLSWRFDKEDFLQVKRSSGPDNGPKVFGFGNIKHEHVAFGFIKFDHIIN